MVTLKSRLTAYAWAIVIVSLPLLTVGIRLMTKRWGATPIPF